MNGLLIVVYSIVCVGIISTIAWLAIDDVRETARLHKEMLTMTPKAAYRRSLVLKYLPQCQFDYDIICKMADEAFPDEPTEKRDPRCTCPPVDRDKAMCDWCRSMLPGPPE